MAAAITGYFYLRQTKKPSLNAVDVLPDKAMVVIHAGNFHELSYKLSQQSLIWNELASIAEFKKLNQQINYFDSLTTENETLKDFFKDRQMLIALYNGGTETNALISFNLSDLAQEKDFTEALQTVLKSEKNSEGVFEIWNGTSKYFLKTISGVVVLSQNQALIENCFDSKIKKQSADPYYQTLMKNMDADDLFNCYINHKELNSVKTKIKLDKFILSGKSVCNIEITPDAITANGFSACDSSSVLNLLGGQPAQPCDFFQALPFSTHFYKAVAISSYETFKSKAGINAAVSSYWKQASDSALFNVRKQLEDNIGDKAVQIEYTQNSSKENALVIELKDTAQVIEALKFVSDSVSIIQNYKSFYLRDSVSDLSKELFGSLFTVHARYAFVHSNYLIISETSEGNNFYLNSMINTSSLAQNEVFMNYAKENLLVNFNYQAYAIVNKQQEELKRTFVFFNDSTSNSFKKLNDYSINITNYKNLVQFRASVKYQQGNQSLDVPGLWTCEADTLIVGKPAVFKNHKSDQNELIFQDAKNNLYLVNATGSILWKKPIGERAMSDYFVVDAFKNNKFQILFNTSSAIHLIDRNGNYVPGYPVKLPKPATNALSLQDYEKTRDYRMIIACSDRFIYNYYITGARNEKFTPIKTNHEVTKPVKYIKVGASDYLVMSDTEGKIYVYSRRGEGRVDLSNKLITNASDYYINSSNNIQNTTLVYFDDKNSLLESISLVDKKEIVKLGANFDEASCFFELIDDDKKMDIVIVDKSKLICYDLSGNELFRYESASDAAYTGGQYYFDADGAYFILNNSINEVHVIEAYQKKIIKNIKGNGTPLVYDLFKDGKKYLMVSDNNLLKCVLLK